MARIGFDEFYGAIYGDRWTGLRQALLPDPQPEPLIEGLLAPYFLDAASVAAAKALGVTDGDEVLDLCAAPGGKTLVIATAMGSSGSLTANDRSSARRARLRRVLEEHLPAAVRDRVHVSSHDASRWGLYEQNRYDRVLVDVPCSSERHVLRSPGHLAEWTPARTKHLAIQAYAMLAAGFTALRPGGTLVYSTCTVSPGENDGVVHKLVDKQGALVELDRAEAPCGEPTELGWIVLPDRCDGLGPLYFARLRKRE